MLALACLERHKIWNDAGSGSGNYSMRKDVRCIQDGLTDNARDKMLRRCDDSSCRIASASFYRPESLEYRTPVVIRVNLLSFHLISGY